MEKNLSKKPEHVTADAGNFSAETVTEEAVKGAEEIPAKGISAAETMRKKSNSAAGKAIYKYRKAVVEPVFGQINLKRAVDGEATSPRCQSGGDSGALNHCYCKRFTRHDTPMPIGGLVE